MSTSKIILNGTPVEILPDESLNDLIERLGLGSKGVAIAVNASVVTRSSWSELVLSKGDHVEILSPAPGG
jgi:sulfur carrier protein